MAASAPDPGTVIYLKDWLTLAALILGPVIAVMWTLAHQDSREKKAAQQRLFVTLMAHRKSIPLSPEWAQSLNLIDVIYADYPKVVAKWHSLYDVVCTSPLNEAKFQHGSLELMSEIAKALGYKSLQQTDIDKFYVPEAHSKQAGRIYEVQTELLRVLKASKSMSEPKDDKS
jgi:hypothetical protein